jgi:hypothetical protein
VVPELEEVVPPVEEVVVPELVPSVEEVVPAVVVELLPPPVSVPPQAASAARARSEIVIERKVEVRMQTTYTESFGTVRNAH